MKYILALFFLFAIFLMISKDRVTRIEADTYNEMQHVEKVNETENVYIYTYRLDYRPRSDQFRTLFNNKRVQGVVYHGTYKVHPTIVVINKERP